jgi:heptosyltransferase I
VPAPATHPAPAPRPVDFARLLIVRLGAMGDIIHTLPAAAALRAAFPAATLGWVVEQRWAELLGTSSALRLGPRSPGRPLVDHLHTVNTKGWRTSMTSAETWKQIAAAAREVRDQGYEVAIDFQGAIRSALIAKLSRANTIYGFERPRETLARTVYDRRVSARGAHVIEQNLSLAEEVAGRALAPAGAVFPSDEVSAREWERRLQDQRIGKFALLNPGAGWGAKQWPAERYGQVARALETDGFTPIVNSGPGEEDLARAVRQASNDAAVVVTCSIIQLIALTRRASLFIGGDTGPLHLAAALAVPVVGIFGPTDPARNGPFGTRSIVLRSPSSQTSHKRLPHPADSLLEISGDQVIAAARGLVENPGG